MNLFRTLALEDLHNLTEEEIKVHLALEYSGISYHGSHNSGTEDEVLLQLQGYNILIAYESVGNYGCDSESFVLLREKGTNKLFEIHGSHCSCFGFEGQFCLESSNIESLMMRTIKAGGVILAGGYDKKEKEN